MSDRGRLAKDWSAEARCLAAPGYHRVETVLLGSYEPDLVPPPPSAFGRSRFFGSPSCSMVYSNDR